MLTCRLFIKECSSVGKGSSPLYKIRELVILVYWDNNWLQEDYVVSEINVC